MITTKTADRITNTLFTLSVLALAAPALAIVVGYLTLWLR